MLLSSAVAVHGTYINMVSLELLLSEKTGPVEYSVWWSSGACLHEDVDADCFLQRVKEEDKRLRGSRQLVIDWVFPMLPKIQL